MISRSTYCLYQYNTSLGADSAVGVISAMSFICVDCSTTIAGSDCAHTLFRLEKWVNKRGCVALCKCKYPVNAKEVRSNIFTKLIDSSRTSNVNAYIYCENDNGQGHVYYGTFIKCVRGNGLAASGMSSCKVFERYAATR